MISEKDFDSEFYVNEYPDVKKTSLKPYEHYVKYGKLLGRLAKKKKNNSVSSGIEIKADEYLDFVEESLKSYKAKYKPLAIKRESHYPLVSVVISAFNAEDTIEKSVLSVLNQSYPNIEVVVCDDFSTDSTWYKLQALEKRCRSLKVIRHNSNYGTYLAKNAAIKKSAGDFILFQDSDDISHPERIAIQVQPLLEKSSLVTTRTKYLRYDDVTGRIIRVGGNVSKFGLITLAIRRRVFDELGYFDCVRKAGDDEFVQRVKHFYSKDSMLDQDVTLYCALLRENSLVADMIKHNADGSVEQNSSHERKEYVKVFKSRFETKNKSYFLNNFKAFPLRSINTYPSSIASLDRDPTKIIVSLCSIPSREDSLEKTLNSLNDQVDIIYLYLDGYKSTPEFILRNNKIKLIKAPANSSPRDNAKFIPYNELKCSVGDFYYFTCDDDIVYPTDYINTMIRSLKKYENKVVVGVHGVVVAENPKSYFKNRFVYHFENDDLSEYALVNNIGTGTAAFHSSILEAINVNEWPQGGMVDIFFGQLCYKEHVAMIVIPRHSNWLYTDPDARETPTLFNEYKIDGKEKLIVNVIRDGCSDGYKAIERVICEYEMGVRKSLERLLPDFCKNINVSSIFIRFRK